MLFRSQRDNDFEKRSDNKSKSKYPRPKRFGERDSENKTDRFRSKRFGERDSENKNKSDQPNSAPFKKKFVKSNFKKRRF